MEAFILVIAICKKKKKYSEVNEGLPMAARGPEHNQTPSPHYFFA